MDMAISLGLPSHGWTSQPCHLRLEITSPYQAVAVKSRVSDFTPSAGARVSPAAEKTGKADKTSSLWGWMRQTVQAARFSRFLFRFSDRVSFQRR